MSGDDQSAVLAETLERISDGIVAADADRRVTYLNDRARRLFGTAEASPVGSDLWTVLPENSRDAGESAVERAVETGRDQSFQWDSDGQSYMARVYADDGGLSILVTEITERIRYERNLGRLHEATRRMLLADSPAEIAELVSRAAVGILNLPVNAVHLYDDERDALVPAAYSAACGEILDTPPSLSRGLAWEAYQSGRVDICTDLTAETDLFNAETPFRSELLIPLGDHGVFIVASTELAEFSETDVTLAELLGANATVAFDQVTNENRLEQQRDDLELLTRMMSHDIRNDLQVVGAVAEILGEHVEGTQLEYVERIRRSTEAAVELTTSAQELTEAMLRSDAAASEVSLGSVLREEIEELRATNPDAVVTIEGELPTVSVRADEMLDSVFRNVLKNAVQHNDAETTEITVGAVLEDDNVRVRIADNGPGVPDDRKEVIFGRGERGMSSQGTGIGLYLVRTLTEQYGGSVHVEDNEPRGAVFVVQLPTV